MEKKITLDLLTQDSVSVLTQVIIEYNGKKIEAEHTRIAYPNSTLGRRKLLYEVGEPYYTSVLTIWGETPTIIDPVPDISY
jgi:hypothetical protein